MKTKAELIAEIDETEAAIAELETEVVPVVPEHDFYLGVLKGYCLDCGNRYCDVGECATCKAVMPFLLEYKSTYPWASDKHRDDSPEHEAKVRAEKAAFEAVQKEQFTRQKEAIRRKDR